MYLYFDNMDYSAHHLKCGFRYKGVSPIFSYVYVFLYHVKHNKLIGRAFKLNNYYKNIILFILFVTRYSLRIVPINDALGHYQ